MRWKFWEKEEPIEPKPVVYTVENPPPFLEDKRIYVCHGEVVFGNSITNISTGRDNEYSITGWLVIAPFPRVGDELLIEMSKGGWGRYVFAKVKNHREPRDMFTATVFGAYGLSDIEPSTNQCDEFITKPHGVQLFRT